MKALLLENEGLDGIPRQLISYCKRNSIDWDFYDMREKFWPENREKTIQFFHSLPDGQKLICHTVFDGFDQLELMIKLLFSIKNKKFELCIMNNYLSKELRTWYKQQTADTTPRKWQDSFNENSDDDSWNKIIEYKRELNEMFLHVLSHHNVNWISLYDDDIQLKDIETIKTVNRYED